MPPPSIHRAASDEFTPEDYEMVTHYAIDTRAVDQRRWLSAYLRAKGVGDVTWVDDLPVGNQCSHCGARIRFGIVLRHRDGTCITVGETCLSNRFEVSKEQFRAERERARASADAFASDMAWIQDERERARALDEVGAGDLMREYVNRLAATVRQTLATYPDLALLTYPEMYDTREDVILSLSGQFLRQGTLSDAQVRLFRDLESRNLEVARTREYSESRARRAEQFEASIPPVTPVPSAEIVGRVTDIYEVETGFGSTVRMRVDLPNGQSLTGTVPASISKEVREGVTVVFTAQVESSASSYRQRKPHEGYFKRPRSAQVIV